MLGRIAAWARRLVAAVGRLQAVVLCVAALALAVMYCGNDNVDPAPKTSYHRILAAGDGHMHFLITRSLVFDRDLDLDNDLLRFGDPWNQPRTVTGRKNVMQQIGPSLVWAPLLALAHVAALVGNVFGADIETHGYTLFHQRILFASSVVFAWLAIAFGIAVARRLGIGRWAATWAAVAALFGTTLVYYATYMPSYAHAMDAAACAIFLARWVATLGELRWRRYIELGVWLGVATMVRVQDLGFGVVLALELALLAWRARDVRVLLRGGASLAIALVMFVPQLYVWNVFYGSWLTTPQGPGQMRYAHPMVMELLFSDRNGWLSSHPIAYVGTLGLVIGAIAGPRLRLAHVRLVCGGLLATIAIQVYVNAVTYEWWSGASFGQRRMASSTLAVLVGLAVLIHAANLLARRFVPKLPRLARQALCVIGLGYFVVWNVTVVRKLKHGANVDRVRVASCCNDIWEPLAIVARPIHREWGNPFEFPASAIYALRYGVELGRWDHAVGDYPLVPGVLGYADGSYRRDTATFNWVGGNDSYLHAGWGPPQKDAADARPYRWTTASSAEAILPTLMPEPHRVTVPIAANAAAGETVDVTITCNGEVVYHAALGPAWTEVVFDTDGTLGDNVIVFAATVSAWRGGPAAPPEGADGGVGIAIGPAHVGLPPR